MQTISHRILNIYIEYISQAFTLPITFSNDDLDYAVWAYTSQSPVRSSLKKLLHGTKHNETREQKRLAFAGKKKQAG